VTGRSPSPGTLALGQVSDPSGVRWPAPAGVPRLEADTGFAAPPEVGNFANPALEKRLSEITRLDMDALRLAWEDMFGRPPPKSISRRLLELAAAYHVQAKVYGGLKPAIRRKLLQAAQSQPDSMQGTARRKQREVLSAGSRLVRQWQGRSHTVEVTDGGFLYAGKRYRSLSQIARAITGARWSGPRFFGL
jgi:hypothetical protein